MKTMMMINMMINMMFLTMKHPLSMGISIIMQTTIISAMTGMMSKSFWFSYILFLMFVGGMMVLFIYMTSLVPNMMFSMSMKQMMIMAATMITMMMILKMKSNMINNDMTEMNINKMIMMKMYTNPSNISIIMLASYLLLTMITVFKITESMMGPLRTTFN
uniref:NADH dehydrogenase subunit 6 n=1 Tax=Sungaya inexpectata TaxID=202437 RepID=UPI0025A9A0AA|nr:NADH dehydrogenase subunit 6 [Sungaya inexpectata]WID87026.1 NADH dehydrogenase subunit 6 [Sungaya inexpectata]